MVSICYQLSLGKARPPKGIAFSWDAERTKGHAVSADGKTITRSATSDLKTGDAGPLRAPLFRMAEGIWDDIRTIPSITLNLSKIIHKRFKIIIS